MVSSGKSLKIITEAFFFFYLIRGLLEVEDDDDDGFLESNYTREGFIGVCLGELIAIGYGERC